LWQIYNADGRNFLIIEGQAAKWPSVHGLSLSISLIPQLQKLHVGIDHSTPLSQYYILYPKFSHLYCLIITHRPSTNQEE
jgi:hypothetical protein